MELDRDYIERRDFPAARRGYDPDAVDRHLAEVAEAVEELGEELRQGREAPAPALSSAAAERVQVILEAAERSAAELESRARESAERQTREANDLAREAGQRAEAEIESRVERVDRATEQMLRRIAELDGELADMRQALRGADSVLEGLEAQAGPLRSEVESMKDGLNELLDRARPAPRDRTTEMSAATGPGVDSGMDEPGLADERALDELDEEAGSDEEPPQPPEPRGAEEEIAPEATSEDVTIDEEEGALAGDAEAVELMVEQEERSSGPRGRRRSGSEDSDEGARLVALNMALNGTPREETDRYLAENFDLDDRDGILDDVYARAGGI